MLKLSEKIYIYERQYPSVETSKIYYKVENGYLREMAGMERKMIGAGTLWKRWTSIVSYKADLFQSQMTWNKDHVPAVDSKGE